MTKFLSVAWLRFPLPLLILTALSPIITDAVTFKGALTLLNDFFSLIGTGWTTEGRTIAFGFVIAFFWLFIANLYEGVWVYNIANQIGLIVLGGFIFFG